MDSAERGSEHSGERRTGPCPLPGWLGGDLTIQCRGRPPQPASPPLLLQQYGVVFLGDQQVQISSTDLWEILLPLRREGKSGFLRLSPRKPSGYSGDGGVGGGGSGNGRQNLRDATGLHWSPVFPGKLTSIRNMRMGSASCRVMISGDCTVAKGLSGGVGKSQEPSYFFPSCWGKSMDFGDRESDPG